MSWKKQLKKLEDNKNWNAAIEFMQKVIEENPDSLDVYLSMNYLLMNLLVEEDHDESKHDYYVELAKKYFKESYAKFSNNPEYLFFTAMTASMSEWYFGIEEETMVKNMMMKSLDLEPDNILYKWGYYSFSAVNIENSKNFIAYSKKTVEDSSIVDFLKSKGSLGEYILGSLTSLSKRMPEDFR